MLKKKYWKKMSQSQREQFAKLFNKDDYSRNNNLFLSDYQEKQYWMDIRKSNRKKSIRKLSKKSVLNNIRKPKLVWVSFKWIEFFFSVIQAVFISIYCGKIQTYLLNYIFLDLQRNLFNYISSDDIQILLSNLLPFSVIIVYALIYLYILCKLLYIIYILIKHFYFYFKKVWMPFIEYDILMPLHNFRTEHGILFGLAISVIRFIIKCFI